MFCRERLCSLLQVIWVERHLGDELPAHQSGMRQPSNNCSISQRCQSTVPTMPTAQVHSLVSLVSMRQLGEEEDLQLLCAEYGESTMTKHEMSEPVLERGTVTFFRIELTLISKIQEFIQEEIFLQIGVNCSLEAG